MTADSDVVGTPALGLDDVLAGLQWRCARGEVLDIAACENRSVAAGEASAVLVTGGLLRVEDLGDPCDLAPGDFLFVPHGHGFTMRALSEAVVLRVRMAPAGTSGALGALPRRVLLTEFAEHEPMAEALLRNLAEEGGHPHGVLRDRVATLVASIAVSSWYARGCAPSRWLLRVDDPGLARAVAAIHAEPGREWTVEALARVALASRSGFAARFRSATGQPPGRYLSAVRIELAQRMLSRDGVSVAAVANRLGYGSDTAFGRAFRRHTGVTPSQWQRRRGRG
ncbi:helix-turn-helix domain-containing protein [Rhodococcus sp. NPDC003318]|uniref:helix-turn-helix domain-containing protein n=1 Tax=Rhodococcus sp. NPDC003318 TaxID=3364503 RepID=UPI003695B141